MAKLYAYWITINYREAYDMFACNGILFNHESPLRGETFVTRKITLGLTKIATGLSDCIFLGNLDAKRDWGHAKDYVYGMYLMLQIDKPQDFVLATGITTSIRDFLIMCFDELGIKIEFTGTGVNEKGIVKSSSIHNLQEGKVVVQVDPQYYRPCEVELLIGNPKKANVILGWIPNYDLQALVKEMIREDLKIAKRLING